MNHTPNKYEYLIILVMIYMTIDLSSMVFAYKIIKIRTCVAAASSLIFPLTYALMDVIAEVYNYEIAKKIVIYGFICDFIFGLIVLLVCHIPSISESQTIAYVQVFGLLLRAVIAQMIGVLTGAFINIHLISKWKIITNGRYFWLRSIGSSTIGEAFMLVISVFIALAGVLSYSELFHLIIYAYLYKIFFAIIAAPFISILVFILKNKMANTSLQPTSIMQDPFGKPDSQHFSSSFPKL